MDKIRRVARQKKRLCVRARIDLSVGDMRQVPHQNFQVWEEAGSVGSAAMRYRRSSNDSRRETKGKEDIMMNQ